MKKTFILLLSLLMIVPSFNEFVKASEVNSSQSVANQNDNLDSEIQEYAKIGEFYESYLLQNQNGSFVVNYQKAYNDNLSRNDLNEIEEYNYTKNSMSEDGQPSLERAKRIMFHGNYCGKGNNGGRPKDKLDAACKRHDECYARYGWGKCKCDKPFIKAAHSIAQNKKYSKKYRKKASRAAILFAVAYMRCK